MTVAIQNVSGPFDSIEAAVDYAVTNSHCVPLTVISGVALAPSTRVQLPLTQVGPTTWKTDFYADNFLDEDYYQEGVSHWSMVAVSFGPTVKGNTFTGKIWRSDMLKGHLSAERYFSTQLYLQPDGTPLAVMGEASRDQFKAPEKPFSVTLHAVRIP